MTTSDVLVIGGGLVGSAIAYGLAIRGLSVVVLDEGDLAYRASRGNFGLVWVQDKGFDSPAYAHWTRQSSKLWPNFAAELTDTTGIVLHYSRPGGFRFCLSEAEFTHRRVQMLKLASDSEGEFAFEMLDRTRLLDRFPQIGEAVVGASFSPHDGHTNPLRLLQSLHAALQKAGGRYLPGHPVHSIRYDRPGFSVTTGFETFTTGKIVLAAGHGTRSLAPMVDLKAPLSPERGQILVTAKVPPFLSHPTVMLRQTGEGSVLIGESKEESGFNDQTTPAVTRILAERAVATFPLLKNVPVIRTWAALRIMTPDGRPIYQQSESCPGAFVASLHSGVTLAAAHAGPLAEAIAVGHLPQSLGGFSGERFYVH